MKPQIRSTLAACGLALLNVLVATGQAQDYTYETNNGTITITGYAGPGGDVTIPNQINGLPVTSIGRRAFADCTSLTSLRIPGSVINWGRYFDKGSETFAGCTNLVSVVFDDGVRYIPEGAFAGCTSLANITIPNSVTSIEGGAFGGCTSLASIRIPESVTSIGHSAFYCCTSLTTVTIPDSVTNIDGTFRGCTGLASITIPDSVTSIGSEAFSYCTSLTNVVIGNGVTTLGYEAFSYCTSLTSLASVKIPSSVTSIGEYAFSYCTGLTNVTIPDSVRSIDYGAFLWCTSLTSVTTPASVTSIGYDAFSGCTSLRGTYSQGNAPNVDVAFSRADNVTVYYLPGTTGWGPTFGGRPTALWILPLPVILTTTPGFGVQPNGYGFRISWATNTPVVVEASTSLSGQDWSPVATNTLVDGWSDFRDPQWASYPNRFYRVRSQ